MYYVAQLYEHCDYQGYFDWNKKAAETGYVHGVYGYALNLLDKDNIFNITPDPVKSYGLISLIAALDGGGSTQLNAQEELVEIAEKMTPEQIKQAEAFAEEWQKIHTPLSYFFNKYGF